MLLGGYRNHVKRRIIFISGGVFLLLLIFNAAMAYLFHYYVSQAVCMTKPEVATDKRCLYIIGQQVYQKNVLSSDLQKQTCGADITDVIPVRYLNNPNAYLLPYFVTNICVTKVLKPKPTTPPLYSLDHGPVASSSGISLINSLGIYNTIVRCYGLHVTQTSLACTHPKDADINNDGNVDSLDYNALIYILYNGRQKISTQAASGN